MNGFLKWNKRLEKEKLRKSKIASEMKKNQSFIYSKKSFS